MQPSNCSSRCFLDPGEKVRMSSMHAEQSARQDGGSREHSWNSAEHPDQMWVRCLMFDGSLRLGTSGVSPRKEEELCSFAVFIQRKYTPWSHIIHWSHSKGQLTRLTPWMWIRAVIELSSLRGLLFIICGRHTYELKGRLTSLGDVLERLCRRGRRKMGHLGKKR